MTPEEKIEKIKEIFSPDGDDDPRGMLLSILDDLRDWPIEIIPPHEAEPGMHVADAAGMRDLNAVVDMLRKVEGILKS